MVMMMRLGSWGKGKEEEANVDRELLTWLKGRRKATQARLPGFREHSAPLGAEVP